MVEPTSSEHPLAALLQAALPCRTACRPGRPHCSGKLPCVPAGSMPPTQPLQSPLPDHPLTRGRPCTHHIRHTELDTVRFFLDGINNLYLLKKLQHYRKTSEKKNATGILVTTPGHLARPHPPSCFYRSRKEQCCFPTDTPFPGSLHPHLFVPPSGLTWTARRAGQVPPDPVLTTALPEVHSVLGRLRPPRRDPRARQPCPEVPPASTE